jgi:hypothetical protein
MRDDICFVVMSLLEDLQLQLQVGTGTVLRVKLTLHSLPNVPLAKRLYQLVSIFRCSTKRSQDGVKLLVFDIPPFLSVLLHFPSGELACPLSLHAFSLDDSTTTPDTSL